MVVPADGESQAPPAPDDSPALTPSLPTDPTLAISHYPPPDPQDASLPFPEFQVYDYDTEFIYEDEYEDGPQREAIDLEKVAVPRWILYAQGVLLGVMAMVGFAFGVMIGGAAPRDGQSAAAVGPLTVRGDVAYNAGDNLPTPDEGAAVLLLPEDARPEQKAAVASLRPGSSPVDASDPALVAIREIGGDFARADPQGRFRLVAPGPGPYFLLIISAHLQRPPNQRAAPQDLAELGRYVESAPELLNQNRYQWSRRRLDESEVISHVFR